MKISPSRDALSPCEPPFFPIYLNVTHSLLLQSCMISNCPECSFSYLISNSYSIIAFTLTFYLLSFSSVVAVTLLCSAAVLPWLQVWSAKHKLSAFSTKTQPKVRNPTENPNRVGFDLFFSKRLLIHWFQKHQS